MQIVEHWAYLVDDPLQWRADDLFELALGRNFNDLTRVHRSTSEVRQGYLQSFLCLPALIMRSWTNWCKTIGGARPSLRFGDVADHYD